MEELQPLSKPCFDVNGRAYIVTGGTAGLGYTIATELIKAGARGIFINGRDKERGEKAADDLRAVVGSKNNCKVEFVQADVSEVDGCRTIVDRAIEVFEKVDGVVNCAATSERCTLESTSPEQWDNIMNTNARSVFLITKWIAAHMKEKKVRGSIVSISSIASLGGLTKVSTYSISKAAVNGATKIHAHELMPFGIRVNSILMGWTVTDHENEVQIDEMGTEDWVKEADKMNKIGRILRPVDIAATVGFLLSDASLMITGSLIDQHPEMVHGCWGP